MGEVFVNWAGNHRCSLRGRLAPRSETEIVEIVKRAAAEGHRLKAVGAGHSWSDIALTDGYHVTLDRYNRLISIDRERCQVTVCAGMRLVELNEVLDRAGMALSNLGSVAEQSVAGVISTGTHGTGLSFGNLATAVTALRLVTGTGEIRTLSADEDPEHFSAARVSLGCLGIITQVTLQCEPAFNLRERCESLPFDEGCARMMDLVAAREHVKVWWLPHTDQVHVFSYERTNQPRNRSEIEYRIDRSQLMHRLLQLVLALGKASPRLIVPLNHAVNAVYFKPLDRVDRSDRLFNLAMPPAHLETELSIPAERAPEALLAVRHMIRSENMRVNFLQEVRFVAGDDIMLSPAHGRDSCQFGGYCGDSRDQARYFQGFERLLADMGGRPHWGKQCTWMGPEDMRERYPEFERFNEIRRALDPKRVFENEYIRRTFG